MERLFNDLNTISKKHNSISIHLTDFPKANHSLMHEVLEERMQLAQTISSLVHSIRKGQNIKVRQPLSKILIPILQPRIKEQIQAVEDLIKTEVNIKEINYIEDTEGIVVKTIKPNFKKLGKEYGPKLKAIGDAVNLLQSSDITELERNNIYNLNLSDGSTIQLTLEDVEIRTQDIPGWSVAAEAGITVALDISISDELKLEGIARDVVNRVQNIRKDSGLDVQDKIQIDVLKTNSIVDKALMENLQYICVETQAHQLNLVDELMQGTAVELDEFTLTLKISK
jgi:isoleucyl-tRNA synthetase